MLQDTEGNICNSDLIGIQMETQELLGEIWGEFNTFIVE